MAPDRPPDGQRPNQGLGYADAPMNAIEWLAAYAEKLGVPAPTTDELKTILDLAGEAAHSSERIAAPVACWLAAKAGAGLDDALRLAGEVSSDA
jgi:hypothetical protein